MSYDPANIFARILRREIPATLLHEDEQCIAFRDIAPQAPFHALVVPRKPIACLGDATAADVPVLGHLLAVASELARANGFNDFRTVVNSGAGAGQSVFHLHVHVLAGRDLRWPPG